MGAENLERYLAILKLLKGKEEKSALASLRPTGPLESPRSRMRGLIALTLKGL